MTTDHLRGFSINGNKINISLKLNWNLHIVQRVIMRISDFSAALQYCMKFCRQHSNTAIMLSIVCFSSNILSNLHGALIFVILVSSQNKSEYETFHTIAISH